MKQTPPDLDQLVDVLSAELGIGSAVKAEGPPPSGLEKQLLQAFELDEEFQREEEVVALIARYPASAVVLHVLLEQRWLGDDRLALGFLARDALQQVLFSNADRALVDLLRTHAQRITANPLLGDLEFLVRPRGELESLLDQQYGEQPTFDDSVALTCWEVARSGALKPQQQKILVRAACLKADLSAALLLDRHRSWPDPEVDRLSCVVGVIERASGLQVAGFPSLAAYLLYRAARQFDDRHAAQRLVELLLNHGWSELAARVLLQIDDHAPETRALQARLALLRGELEPASQILEPLADSFSDPEELLDEYPMLAATLAEWSLVTGQASGALDLLPRLFNEEPRRLYPARILALASALVNLPDGAERALAEFVPFLVAFPLHRPLWTDLMAFNAEYRPATSALRAAVARVLNLHYHGMRVWEALVQLVPGFSKWKEPLLAKCRQQEAST